MPDSLQPHGLEPAGLLCPWNSTGKIPGVGCHFLLQGIFPPQGSCFARESLPSEPPGNPTAAAAKSCQSCPTLCDPIDGSPTGSSVPGSLQARILGWVAISFSSAWKWKVKVKLFSCVWLLATPWTAACQAPPSMGFSRQEYWRGVPLPPLGNLTIKRHF